MAVAPPPTCEQPGTCWLASRLSLAGLALTPQPWFSSLDGFAGPSAEGQPGRAPATVPDGRGARESTLHRIRERACGSRPDWCRDHGPMRPGHGAAHSRYVAGEKRSAPGKGSQSCHASSGREGTRLNLLATKGTIRRCRGLPGFVSPVVCQRSRLLGSSWRGPGGLHANPPATCRVCPRDTPAPHLVTGVRCICACGAHRW